MKGTAPKLENGGWTPSLRTMAIDIMDKMILRPVSMLVSDPRNGNINTFQGIRDKIIRKKYLLLANWRDEVLKVFSIARESNDPLINSICTEFEQFFNKKYGVLEKFSQFKFKDCLVDLLQSEGLEIPELPQEEIPVEEQQVIEVKEETVESININSDENLPKQ